MAETPTFDELDFQLLHALELDGRAPFSRIGEILGVSDQTVARRFRRLTSVMGLRVVGVRDAERLGQDNWILRLRCAPDAADAIARALARRPDTAWIGLTSAGTEVYCVTRFASAGEHEQLILGQLPRTPSISDITAHQLLHRFFGGPVGWLAKDRNLSPEQIEALTPPWGATLANDPTDRVSGAGDLTAADEPLVRALEKDGRATFAELQRVTGQSESSVRRRLDQLLRGGGVFLDVEFDSGAFGFSRRALLWITAEARALDDVGRALARQREVAAVFATTGGSNLMAVIVCRDTASVYRYLKEQVGPLDGVQRVEVSPVLRVVKQLTYEERSRRDVRPPRTGAAGL